MTTTGFYVMRNGTAHYYADSEQSAIEWATGAAPRKPPRGFKWEVWRRDGVRVAVIRYNPMALIAREAA